MAVNIVTGMTGQAHITSDDDRSRNAAIFGKDKYLLDYGESFTPEIINNNLVRVRDGMLMNQGTQMGIELNDYEDCVIENGISGTNRIDLIVMRYEKNADTSTEKASLVVIKGTSATDPSVPEYESGNILDGGDLIDDFPLWCVRIESLTMTSVYPAWRYIINNASLYDLHHLNDEFFSHKDSEDNPHHVTKSQVGLGNVENTSDNQKEALSASRLQNTSAIGSTTRPVYFSADGVPVPGSYTLGTACAKNYTNIVTPNSTNLVTSGAVSDAISTATNYESGGWTPELYETSTSLASPIAKQGAYIKIGKMVFIIGYLAFEDTDIQCYKISGLPFSANVSMMSQYHSSLRINRTMRNESFNVLFSNTTECRNLGWYDSTTDKYRTSSEWMIEGWYQTI